MSPKSRASYIDCPTSYHCTTTSFTARQQSKDAILVKTNEAPFSMSSKQRSENGLVQLLRRQRSFEEKHFKGTNKAAHSNKTYSESTTFDVVVVEALRSGAGQDERNEISTVYEMELHQLREGPEKSLPTISEAKNVPLPLCSKSETMISSSPCTVHVFEKNNESPLPLVRTPEIRLKSSLPTSTGSSLSKNDEDFAFSLSESESKDKLIDEKRRVDDEEENSILSTSTASTTTNSASSSLFDGLQKKYKNRKSFLDQVATPNASTHQEDKPFKKSCVSVIFDSADYTSRTKNNKRDSNYASAILSEIKEVTKDILLAGEDFRAATSSAFSCGSGCHYEPVSPTFTLTTSSQSSYFED